MHRCWVAESRRSVSTLSESLFAGRPQSHSAMSSRWRNFKLLQYGAQTLSKVQRASEPKPPSTSYISRFRPDRRPL